MTVIGLKNAVTLVDVLAKSIIESPQNIGDQGYVVLPTQRLCRALEKALTVKRQALIMPKIFSFQDVHQLLPLIGQNNLPKVLNSIEAQLLLQPLIHAFQEKEGVYFGDSSVLALKLYQKFEDCVRSDVPFDRLETIDVDYQAVHRQKTVAFLKIMACHWPKILAAHKMCTPAMYQKQLVQAILKHWRIHVPGHVWAAVDVRRDKTLDPLLVYIARLDKGILFLPGFPEKSMENILESNPYYGFHDLITSYGVTASSDSSLTVDTHVDTLMCTTFSEESHSIACATRSALDLHPSVTIVTPSRELARRIKGVLGYWGISVDDSGGESLLDTSLGHLWQSTVVWGEDPYNLEKLLVLFKHPWVSGTLRRSEIRSYVQAFEYYFRTKNEDYPTPWHLMVDPSNENIIGFHDFFQQLLEISQVFCGHLKNGGAFSDILRCHEDLVSFLCGGHVQASRGAFEQIDIFMKCIENGPLVSVGPGEYKRLLLSLLNTQEVRLPRGNGQQRVRILGVLEARFIKADYMIIGGMTEGIWPKIPSPDPWLSRGIEEKIGFPVAAVNLGIAAYDFKVLLDNPNVFITYGATSNGEKALPSRFLEMCVKRQGAQLVDVIMGRAFRQFFATPMEEVIPALPPTPRPDVHIRPRKFTITDMSTLLLNPYAIYVRKILGLKDLNPVMRVSDERHFGILVHRILQVWLPHFYVEKDVQKLKEIGLKLIDTYLPRYISNALECFMARHRLERIIYWFQNTQQQHQDFLEKSWTEVSGEIICKAPLGGIHIKGIIDRMDLTCDGILTIIDYKTGLIPTLSDVESGFSGQLPLEALMVTNSFDLPYKVGPLVYWQVSGKSTPGQKKVVVEDAQDILENVWVGLQNIFTAFDDTKTAYHARPYGGGGMTSSDHLARLQEWVGL